MANIKQEVNGEASRYYLKATGAGTDADPHIQDVALSGVTETSARGGTSLAVTLQDQTTGVLDFHFLRELSTPTLAVNTAVGDLSITLTAGHGLTTIANAGQTIELADQTDGTKFMQAEIISVTGDVIELDTPVNQVYTTTNTDVVHSTPHMEDVAGTPAAPLVFRVAPTAVQAGDMVKMNFDIRDDAAMGFGTFGGIAKLTYGVVIRIKNSDGTYRNLYNFKENGDIIQEAGDRYQFLTGVGGTERAFAANITWAGQGNHGVAIRLDGSLGEELQAVVQDDLTALSHLHINAQGSELQGD